MSTNESKLHIEGNEARNFAKRAARLKQGQQSEAAAAKFTSLQRLVQLPLFDEIEAAGGAARPRDLYGPLADRLGVEGEGRDATRTSSDGRTHNVFEQQVRWARQTAVMEGLIGGERGRWELTDAGFEKLGKIRRGKVVMIYSTGDGIALWAHAEDAAGAIETGSIKLVLTSPPYPTIDRAYGKMAVPEWLAWMKHLTAIWKQLLTADGTIAVNLMDVFVKGTPAISPYIERFTLAAIDDVGLHLAGRMFWHSPTKLGNIMWTAREKVRPRNSVEQILLFSREPKPAWDINRMDRPAYSQRSQSRLERDEARPASLRPSGYDIAGKAFARRASGPLPGNLVVAGGAGGTDEYSKRCRAAGVEPHPARFPAALPRQVILMTTDVGDVVYDPMAGSNTTGWVAAGLGRRWLASEPMRSYVDASTLRFDHVQHFEGGQFDRNDDATSRHSFSPRR